jgi:tetratricopeptide (TPR) repeat protein
VEVEMDKNGILNLIQSINSEEQALFENLPETERNIHGTPDRWAPKDVLAHIAAWKARFADNLAAFAQGRPETKADDFQRVNETEFDLYQKESWEAVRKKAADANRRIREGMDGMDEKTLDVLRESGQPEWQVILGTAYMHPVSHLAQIYADRGDRERADRMQMQAAEDLLALGGDRKWDGTVKYNLACHFALMGDARKAVQVWREALKLNPGLKDWSQKDTDLDSIRGEPEYRALYEG